MILTARLDGAPAHQIGDEIWHEPLHEAIRHEAEATVEHLPARLLALIGRDDAVDLIARDMTAALRQIGDSYHAIDGVLYELVNGDPIDQQADEASLDAMAGAPVVIEAIFQELAPGGAAPAARSPAGATKQRTRCSAVQRLMRTSA